MNQFDFSKTISNYLFHCDEILTTNKKKHCLLCKSFLNGFNRVQIIRMSTKYNIYLYKNNNKKSPYLFFYLYFFYEVLT